MEKNYDCTQKYTNIKNARKFRGDNLRTKKDAKSLFPALVGLYLSSQIFF